MVTIICKKTNKILERGDITETIVFQTKTTIKINNKIFIKNKIIIQYNINYD